MPGTDNDSSTSISVVACFPSCWSVGVDVLWTLIGGISKSIFRGESRDVGLLTGGGDRNLGDIGQRGVSLISEMIKGF